MDDCVHKLLRHNHSHLCRHLAKLYDGLHMFFAAGGGGSGTVVVPVSAEHFLVIDGSTGPGGYIHRSQYVDPKLLANTIAAIDPRGASVKSTSEQQAAVESEKEAYESDRSYLPLQVQ
jgi:hypothetical protein